MPNPATADDDRYLLRGLVWCALCDRAMVPAATLEARFYECDNEGCPRPGVPAIGLEQLVWRQYSLLYEDTDGVVPTSMRWAALRQRLRRVRVGEDIFELWHEWAE